MQKPYEDKVCNFISTVENRASVAGTESQDTLLRIKEQAAKAYNTMRFSTDTDSYYKGYHAYNAAVESYAKINERYGVREPSEDIFGKSYVYEKSFGYSR